MRFWNVYVWNGHEKSSYPYYYFPRTLIAQLRCIFDLIRTDTDNLMRKYREDILSYGYAFAYCLKKGWSARVNCWAIVIIWGRILLDVRLRQFSEKNPSMNRLSWGHLKRNKWNLALYFDARSIWCNKVWMYSLNFGWVITLFWLGHYTKTL